MSYTCPDCEDGILSVKLREIELVDGEVVQLDAGDAILKATEGRIVVTSVACNNGCSAESNEEEEEEDADAAACGKEGCKKKGPHRHYAKRGE